MTTAAPFYTLKQETRHERRTIDKTLRAFKIWVIYKQDNLLCEFDEEATEQEARAVLAALQFAHIKTSREHLLELLKEAAEETQDYKEGGFLTRDDGTAKNPGKWHEEAKALFSFGADEPETDQILADTLTICKANAAPAFAKETICPYCNAAHKIDQSQNLQFCEECTTEWELDPRPARPMEAHPDDCPAEDDAAPIFTYVIDKDERGEFSASVRDENGAFIYEFDGHLFHNGQMKHKNDVSGLSDYLKYLQILPEDAILTAED